MSKDVHEMRMAALAVLIADLSIDLEEEKEERKNQEIKFHRMEGGVSREDLREIFEDQIKRGMISFPDIIKKKVPVLGTCFFENQEKPTVPRMGFGPLLHAQFFYGDERIDLKFRISFIPFVTEEK